MEDDIKEEILQSKMKKDAVVLAHHCYNELLTTDKRFEYGKFIKYQVKPIIYSRNNLLPCERISIDSHARQSYNL